MDPFVSGFFSFSLDSIVATVLVYRGYPEWAVIFEGDALFHSFGDFRVTAQDPFSYCVAFFFDSPVVSDFGLVHDHVSVAA